MKKCGFENVVYEEKETDVAIAVKAIDLLIDSPNSNIVFVSGDTDMAPAIRLAKRRFLQCKIVCLFPFKRKSKEIEKLVDFSINIKPKKYLQFQFDPQVRTAQNKIIQKPIEWYNYP